MWSLPIIFQSQERQLADAAHVFSNGLVKMSIDYLNACYVKQGILNKGEGSVGLTTLY